MLRRRLEGDDISNFFDVKADRSRQTEPTSAWPNAQHFASVLKAHAKTKSPGGAKKALALLSYMERRFHDNAKMVHSDNGHLHTTDYHLNQTNAAKPDIVCYCIVIDAFANSRLLEASSVALRLLNAVEAKYDAGDVLMKPNTRTYTAVILSMVHSPFIEDDRGKKINKAERAWSMIERMKKNGVLPNSYTYNYVINCAAQTNDAEEQQVSFEIALRAFQELREKGRTESDMDHCHPDNFTFAFMLKACNNLLPAGTERTKTMTRIFRECCRSGYLNDAILDRLCRGVSPNTFYELIEMKSSDRSGYMPKNTAQIHASELPRSWSRHDKSGRRTNKFPASSASRRMVKKKS